MLEVLGGNFCINLAQLEPNLWLFGADQLKTLHFINVGNSTNLLLHLLHLHLASLVVGLVEPKLSLGASQLVLGFLELVLQFSVFHGTVDSESSEAVHLRGRLPLVSQISGPLQLNVHPAIAMDQTFVSTNMFKYYSSSFVVKARGPA